MEKKKGRESHTKVLSWFWTVLFLATPIVAPDWTDCTQSCICKWASGKKTAICASSNITMVPRNLSSDMQVIDLQSNIIDSLPRDAFSNAGLINLQKIFMKSTNLKQLHHDAFRYLKILVELDLSYNALEDIPRGTFHGNDRLKILLLTGNPLKVLINEQFPNLPHLRTLDLESCQIKSIELEAFVHLTYLENLNLKFNELKRTTKVIFLPIVKLKSLELQGNPWVCDCELRPFRNWYLSSNLHSESLACVEPDFYRGKHWEDISSLEFACRPEVRVRGGASQRLIGENITFGCNVIGDPEPDVLWLYNSMPLGAFNHTRGEGDYRIDIERGLYDKWVNLTLTNLSVTDTGEYTCQARSFSDVFTKNVTFVLDVFDGYRLGHFNLYLFVAVLMGCMLVLMIIVATIVCSCVTYNRKQRRNTKQLVAPDKNFYDQDKQLLDWSSTNGDPPLDKNSIEILSARPNVQLLKQPSTISVDRFQTLDCVARRPRLKESSSMMPLSTSYPSGVYPPPPEFSTGGNLGNILISVSLSQDPTVTVERFPDLVDSHRTNTTETESERNRSLSFYTLPSSSSFTTLPRRRTLRDSYRLDPVYDNMGKRVTIGGSSTIILDEGRDEIPTPPPPPLSCKPDVEYEPL